MMSDAPQQQNESVLRPNLPPLKPVVLQHLLHVQPVLGFSIYESEEQLHQLLCQPVVLALQLLQRTAVGSLELLVPLASDHRVVPIGACCVLEGQPPQDHGEEHHAKCEHVCRLAIVGLAGRSPSPVNLRGHVASPGALAVPDERVFCGEDSGKAEVGQLGSEPLGVFGDEDVVQLNVPMNYRITVQMQNPGCSFSEEQSSLGHAGSMILDIFQQVTFSCVLLNQQIVITTPTRQLHSLPVLERLQNVVVSQLAQYSPLIQQVFGLFLATLGHCLNHHLQFLVGKQQNLRIAAPPQQSQLLLTQSHHQLQQNVHST